MVVKKKVWKRKRKNREGFEEDKEGWAKRIKEGKRNVRIATDLRRIRKKS